jgi:hypothetical protein
VVRERLYDLEESRWVGGDSGEAPMLYEIEVDQGFSLEDLLLELGRLELRALGCVKHGDRPQEGDR